MSRHMMVAFEPPLVACAVGSADLCFYAPRTTGECLIAVSAPGPAEKVIRVGDCSGRDIDELEALTTVATARSPWTVN